MEEDDFRHEDAPLDPNLLDLVAPLGWCLVRQLGGEPQISALVGEARGGIEAERGPRFNPFGEREMVQLVGFDSVARLAAYAADPSNAPEWYVNIDTVEWKTPPPVALGSRLAFVAHFLGRRMAYTYEVVDLVPGERIVMRTAEGPFPMETTYTWAPAADGTRMTLRNRGEPAGFSKVVAPFMAAAMRRANKKDLARLKALLERP